jgi:hypothetical protein
MTCRICGSRCIGNRCADCEQDAAAEARAGDDGGDSDDQPAWVLVECTACGTEYWDDGEQSCPDCDSQRRRSLGETAEEHPGAAEGADPLYEQWKVEQQGLDGQRHRGQATLTGGVARLQGGDGA